MTVTYHLGPFVMKMNLSIIYCTEKCIVFVYYQVLGQPY